MVDSILELSTDTGRSGNGTVTDSSGIGGSSEVVVALSFEVVEFAGLALDSCFPARPV